jgi:hypothetical protein
VSSGVTSGVRVDTIQLDSLGVGWARIAAELEDWCASWENWCTTGENHLDEARAIARDLRRLADCFIQARDAYEHADALNAYLLQRTADVCMWFAGRTAGATVWLWGPAAVSTGLGLGLSQVAVAVLPQNARDDVSGFSTRVWASALSAPLVVRFVEMGLGSLDEGALGLLGMPLPMALGLGTAGLGVTSLAGISRLASRINGIVANPSTALAASAGAGSTVTTSVERLPAVPVGAPRDVADALARIPTDADGGAQVRIEEFGDTHVVYIGGTVDGSLGASPQPWDMSSNLAALGGDAGASENAVRRAMTDAGIRQGDPVILVGHSQGGLVAMRVAQSPDVTAQAVITAGAPIHAMSVPDGLPVIAVEHTGDLVPALGGPVTNAQPGLTYVRSSGAHTAPSSEPTLLPAHRLESYVESARQLDGRHLSDATSVEAIRTQLQTLPDSGTSTLWRATRSAAER